MSELERLMSILRKVVETPDAREEFRVELFRLLEKNPDLYEETMVELEKLEPVLHHETRDFMYNVLEVRGFLQKAEKQTSS